MNRQRATAGAEQGPGITRGPSRVPELGRGAARPADRRTAPPKIAYAAGIALPAEGLSEALTDYIAKKYTAGRDTGRFPGHLFDAAARACLNPEVSDSAHFPSTAGQPGADWITIAEWARRYGIPSSTARRWVSRDMVKGRRVGRQWFMDSAASPPPRTRRSPTDKETKQ